MDALPLRVIQDGRLSPAENMARDEALFQNAAAPTFRIYQWSVECLTLGYFTQSRLVPAAGHPFVRRCTGGGIVEHGRDITFSIVMPALHPLAKMPAGETYQKIHQWVREALAVLEMNTQLAPCCQKAGTGQCFEGYVKYDLLHQGRKIGGGAQKRGKNGFLHQGSLQVPGVGYDVFASIFSKILARELVIRMEIGQMTFQEEQMAIHLEQTRYSKPEWNEKF